MYVVLEDHINKAIDDFDALEETKIPDFIDKMGEEQPVILSYAMAMGEEFNNDEYSQDLLYYTLIIWQSYKYHFETLPQVTEDTIYKEEEKLENLALDETEPVDILNALQQPNLFAFIYSELIQNNEAEDDIVDVEEIEEDGIMFSLLQVIINAFHTQISESARN